MADFYCGDCRRVIEAIDVEDGQEEGAEHEQSTSCPDCGGELERMDG